MFSDKLQEYAQKKYEQRLPVLRKIGEVVAGKLPLCTKEEQILMKFFYGTMPLRDAGEYEFEVFLGFVRHSLMVYRTMEWCREVPEEIFLHHILYYRINSENIEDCRQFFYEKLIDRIKGKTLQEAVLEINYWCAENGSYEASDHRTISPLVLYRSGKGRCGEESTFAVTAFRSVGIPARQVYAPWWAHCDDNHAWVEVYIEGKWHFLGACEPEEILDTGWFVNASSRALLIHTRNFSDYGDDLGEPCVGREDRIWFYNVTAGYAKTRQFEIRVLEADGRAVGQADVFVEVLNSGEYHSVAKLCTNEEGKASILIGLGSIHLRIVKGKKGREVTVNTRVQESAAVVIREDWFAEGQGEWTQLDLEAPEDSPIHRTLMSKEQKDRSLRKLCRANEIRSGRIEGYYVEEKAARYPEEKEILHAAAGNFDEIYSFLDKDSNVDRRHLLHSLTVKDYKDAKAAILEKHLSHASKYRERWEKAGKLDIYISYILCPRIYLEEMTYYREFIEKYFGGQAWLSDPFAIWGYIERTIGYDSAEDYGTIFTTPVGTLSLRFGNLVSRRILFVAICRTFGIPARISPVNMEAEAYLGEAFVSVEHVMDGEAEDEGKQGQSKESSQSEVLEQSKALGQIKEPGQVKELGQSKALGQLKEPGKSKEPCQIILRKTEEQTAGYYQTWTIAKFDGNRFITQNYAEESFVDNCLCLEAEAGFYRILTTNRLPNGNQLAAEYRFCLEEGQTEEVQMHFRKGSPEEMLVEYPLEDFEVTKDGKQERASCLTGEKITILAFLDEGQEPTEHVLNEVLEQQKYLDSQNFHIYFVLKGEEALQNKTLGRVLESVLSVRVVYGAFDEIVEPLARRMYVDPDKLPLLLVVRPGLIGIYASSGYNVGSVEMMLKCIREV